MGIGIEGLWGIRNWRKELEIEKGNNGIWIQKRDLEILKFCLEMKFADTESINQKYFDAKNQEMFGARKRIQKLETSGHLRSVCLLSGTAKKFYVTTPKGHRELSKMDILGGVPKPVTKLSVVTFEHDLGVLKARMLLEKQGRATNWRSERLLKSQTEAATGRLQRDFMPDAIFTSRQGKVCAFEFENKPKTATQLREKVFRLKALMDQTEPVFGACMFVAATENLKNKIQNITQVFPNRFVVQSVMDLKNFNEGRQH